MREKKIAYITKTSDDRFEQIKIFNNLDELLDFSRSNHSAVIIWGGRDMIDYSEKYSNTEIDFEIEIYDDYRE